MKGLTTHLVWTIAVLLLAISVLLWRLPNGEALSSYISFAASLASLVLAVVAIFQSILSSHSFSQAISKIQLSAETIVSETERLNRATVSLGEEADSTLRRLSDLPERIQDWKGEISSQLNQIQMPSHGENIDAEHINGSGKDYLKGKVLGFVISIYCIALSFKTKKYINVYDIFKGIPNSKLVRDFVSGSLATLQYVSLNGIKIVGVSGNYRVDSLGNFNLNSILESVQASEYSMGAAYDALVALNNYFSEDVKINLREDQSDSEVNGDSNL